jgi:hypothetical protein
VGGGAGLCGGTSQWQRQRGVACGRLRGVANGSGRRPKFGGAWGGRLGAARLAVVGVVARGAAAWRRGRARCGASWQLRAGVRERGELCELLRLEQHEDKA